MPRSQFVVPQFLDVEPKIIGPITLRQFIIVVGIILAEFIIYRLFLSVLPMIALGVPIGAVGVAFAFGKVNGQPLHFIVLNMLQTIKKPSCRVWDKTLTDAEVRLYLKKEVIEALPQKKRKAPLEFSRLNELALVVNTGGVYKGEDDGS